VQKLTEGLAGRTTVEANQFADKRPEALLVPEDLLETFSFEHAMGEKTGIVHFTQEIRDRLQKRTLFENNIQNIIPLVGWHSGLPPVSY
jgi:hypothetical protein